MNISWNITDSDIRKVKNMMTGNDNPFVQARKLRNVQKQNIVIDQDKIIRTMIMCLLTSQQRSGPNSTIGQFLRQDPFPITAEKLDKADNVEEFVKETFRKFGLKRFIDRISSFFASNLQKFKKENWEIINELNVLIKEDSKYKEREIADSLNKHLDGFGPKQSRNFLQAIGLTKYEIPIDSRITNWLNDFGFPVTLNSSPLADVGYYHFVSEGIQEICVKAEIYPCLLDAAIFSSFDNGEWTNENTIF